MSISLAGLLVFAFLLNTCICIRNYWQRQNKKLPKVYGKILGFGVDANLLKALRLQQKMRREFEHQKLQVINEGILKEEAKRKKIYEKHLLKYQGGSNLLRDFYTNRF